MDNRKLTSEKNRKNSSKSLIKAEKSGFVVQNNRMNFE
jgi:hypothetical protein